MSQFTLHIFLSSIESETRLYKEAAHTLATGVCSRVVVLGLWDEGLSEREAVGGGLEVYRLPTVVRRYKRSALLRTLGPFRKLVALLSLIQYAVACIVTARRLRPDHVSCHNAIALPMAWAASRISGATLEYLPHELETQRAGLSGLEKTLTRIIERSFIRSARNVVVVCDPIREWYEGAYALTNVHVIRNVPERSAVQIRSIPGGGFREKFDIPSAATVFVYQGLFSAGRGIEMMLEAFESLDPEHCHLVLMGYGETEYQNLIDESARNSRNIHYHAAVAREWIVSYSAGADVGIFISERASLSYRYSLPNKFFEWAHAGLPILVSDNLEYQANLLRGGGFGWSTPLGELAAAVKRVSGSDLTSYIENARLFSAEAVWEEDAKSFAQVYRHQVGKKEK